VIAQAALPSWGFPWLYLRPARLALRGFPAGSFIVAPQLGEDARPVARSASVEVLGGIGSRSLVMPQLLQCYILCERRSLAFAAPQLEQLCPARVRDSVRQLIVTQ
jgi:hypothetical protein